MSATAAIEELLMSLQTNGAEAAHTAAVANNTRARADKMVEAGLIRFASLEADNMELNQKVVEMIAALDEARATNKRLERDLAEAGKERDRYMRQSVEAITSLNNAQSMLSTAYENARAA